MTTITTHEHRIGLLRAAIASAATVTLLFVLCWIGAVIGVPVTHLWIQGFTLAPVDSVQALMEGVGWSIVGGLIAGGTAAFVYNIASGLQRRG